MSCIGTTAVVDLAAPHVKRDAMRRLSVKQKVRFSRRARRVWKKGIRRRRMVWLRSLRLVTSVTSSKEPPRPIRSSAAATIYGVEHKVAVRGDVRPVPEVLCIEQNRDEVLDFLDSLRERIDQSVENGGHPSTKKPSFLAPRAIGGYWDFALIKYVSPAVGLMVAAEFHRLAILTGWHPPAINLHQWDPTVIGTLDQLGFFGLLKIKPSDKPAVPAGATHILGFRAAELADDAPGKLIDELECVANELMPDSGIDFSRLFGALMEGVINTREHAYPPGYERTFRHAKRWWATAAVHRSLRRVSVVIYDQGVTVPASLPRWALYEQVTSLLDKVFDGSRIVPKSDDGATIAAAMRVSRTSTGLQNRGKGLAEMEAFLDTCIRGYLRIVSRYGEYICRAHEGPMHFTYGNQLRGTLVEWDVTV